MNRSGRRRLSLALVFVVAGAASAPAIAGSVVVTIVDGRKAKADITLPNPGGGNYTAEFEIEFEVDGLQNLTVECIGISADVLDAGEIADVEGRLPHNWQHIDANFPVRVTVEPPAGCGLEFRNGYHVSIDTPDLVYTTNPPSIYRMLKAPVGGQFQYVTGAVTAGSVRVRGSSGGFSEFVVVSDATPQYYTDCNIEYDAVEALLASSSISLTARQTLTTDLELSRAAYDVGNYDEAIARLASFDAHCVDYAGAALPNRWRSARDLVNFEGTLVGRTDTLRFLMGRLAAGSP